MGRFSAYLLNRFRSWESSTRIGFITAFLLLVLTFLLLLYGPLPMRQPALIGVIGLVFALQIIFMWGNRNMVTPFTQAQRRYLAEDFAGARAILELTLDNSKPDVSSLTLLANTYRQLGLLDESEEIVKKALALRPFDHFPLYSFGRTLLIMGRYTQAIEVFRQALEAGAPLIVRFDLGESLYRQSQISEAIAVLKTVHDSGHEPFRVLMTAYLLYQAGAGQSPSPDLLESGLPYWVDLARRFGHTPYGQLLAVDIEGLRRLVEGL
jgi:tetratricopeptide (TPR) repeat protein